MRRLLAIGALVALAACAKTSSTAPDVSASAGASSRVGFVRMDDLVKKHPLYGQLAQYDSNITALNLSAQIPHAVAADPFLRRHEAELEKQLNVAADRTNKLIEAKSKEYQQREKEAIDAALREAGAPGGPTVAGVTQSINATAAVQTQQAATTAQHDLDAYRRALSNQDRAQSEAAQRTLTARANRTYRAKLDELNAKESALTLSSANADASQRLALRTKLSSLALDDATREDVQKQLAALDRKESDALAAQRNRDQQELTALQAQLRDQVRGELETQVGAIHSRTMQKLQARTSQLRQQFQPLAAPVVAAGGPGAPAVARNISPELRAKIVKLHDDYSHQFQNDAKATIADFNKTKVDLKRRFDALHGVDAAASQNAQAQIASIQKKRDDLYDQMVAQIDREVKVIALQKGISVVVTNVAAPAGGVDLTDDAMKDIESLHE